MIVFFWHPQSCTQNVWPNVCPLLNIFKLRHYINHHAEHLKDSAHHGTCLPQHQTKCGCASPMMDFGLLAYLQTLAIYYQSWEHRRDQGGCRCIKYWIHTFKASAWSAFLGKHTWSSVSITNAQVYSFFLTVSHIPAPQKFHLSPWKYMFRPGFTRFTCYLQKCGREVLFLLLW